MHDIIIYAAAQKMIKLINLKKVNKSNHTERTSIYIGVLFIIIYRVIIIDYYKQ